MNGLQGNLNKYDAYLLLNGIQKVGPVSATRLLGRFGNNPINIFKSTRKELQSIRGIGEVAINSLMNSHNISWLEKEKQKIKKHGTSFITREKIPLALQQIFDSPVGLYLSGEIPQDPYVAIVGTRIPSLYGRRTCREIARELAKRGFCIVSGMARGIDAEAHEGALEGGGKTIAFLGCGLDVVYPPEHLNLYRRISKNGAVLSEFPFGRKADKRTFPMRNRLVSGICSALVVIESASSGGSLITAQLAADQGRQVFALPGRVDQNTSSGCHKLIREGATLIRSAQDIIEDLSYSLPLNHFNVEKNSLALSNPEDYSTDKFTDDEKKIINVLMDGSLLTIDEICAASNLNLQAVSSGLIMLELNRTVGKRNDGKYEIF